MVESQLLVEGRKKQLLLFIFCTFFFSGSTLFSENTSAFEFECLSETRVSGLFQNQRKFLKNSEFFPYKTIMSFTNDYKNLKEKDNSIKNITEAKYNYKCKKNESNTLGLMLPNTVPTVIVFFAIQYLNKTAAILNFTSGSKNILSCLKTSKINYVIT